MRRGRRMFATREQPLHLHHGWWPCEGFVSGTLYNSSGGPPLLVQPAGAPWSITTGGLNSSNRIAKSTQTETANVFGQGQLFKFNPHESVSFWAWMWPDSADLNSDGFTKPMFGPAYWASSETGILLTCQNTLLDIGICNGRGQIISRADIVALGTLGALVFLIVRWDAATQRLGLSRNGGAFAETTAGPVLAPFTDSNTTFCLGNYMIGSSRNTGVSSPGSRNTIARWDDIGWVRGKAISNTEASWLWNGGAGRTYEAAAAEGIFRGDLP